MSDYRLLDRALFFGASKSWLVKKLANVETVINKEGVDIRIPLLRGAGWTHLDFGFESLGFQSVLRRLIAVSPADAVVIDVGANFGQTLLNVLMVSRDIEYWGFEPDVTAASYVRELIRRNGLSRHQILPIGLGSRSEIVTIYQNEEGDASGTIGLDLRPGQMYRTKKAIATVEGDPMLLHLADRNILLLKIDTEGYEDRVLAGLRKFLDARRPPVFFEVMGYGHLLNGTYPREYFGGELSGAEIDRLVRNRRENARALTAFFHKRGFRLLRCSTNGDLEESESADVGPERDSGEMNFLAMPAERKFEGDTSVRTEELKMKTARA